MGNADARTAAAWHAEARRRRDELADAVDELATGDITMLGKEPWKFVQDSAAFRDNEAPDVALGERTESVANILRYRVCGEHPEARRSASRLRSSPAAEASLMGAVSVSRGVFEACLWAAGLDRPDDQYGRAPKASTHSSARASVGGHSPPGHARRGSQRQRPRRRG